jgi:hypothetical protein
MRSGAKLIYRAERRIKPYDDRRHFRCWAVDRKWLVVKVCGCRPRDGGAAHTGGRRTQTFNGGNRGKGLRQAVRRI